jgi:hypothetical protein
MSNATEMDVNATEIDPWAALALNPDELKIVGSVYFILTTICLIAYVVVIWVRNLICAKKVGPHCHSQRRVGGGEVSFFGKNFQNFKPACSCDL